MATFGLVLLPLTNDLISNHKKYAVWKRCVITILLYSVGIGALSYGAYKFHKLVQFRIHRGDWSVTKKYEKALAASIAYSNKYMNYNQEINDLYENDTFHERFETHPVWHMRRFPTIHRGIVEETGNIYNRVFQEEDWTMRGNMPPRLLWADNMRMRARVEYADKYMTNDYYKENSGVWKPALKEPSW